jgi:hypothetical protein
MLLNRFEIIEGPRQLAKQLYARLPGINHNEPELLRTSNNGPAFQLHSPAGPSYFARSRSSIFVAIIGYRRDGRRETRPLP